MVGILKEYLNLREYKIFHVDFNNLAGEDIIFNSDIVIWGKVN